jgi:hypothetical protein
MRDLLLQWLARGVRRAVVEPAHDAHLRFCEAGCRGRLP